MKTMAFQSAAPLFGEILDARHLTLRMEFCLIPKEDAFAMAEEVVLWIQQMLIDQFVARWSMDNRKTVEPAALREETRKHTADHLWINMEGYVISPVVHNKTTMREYQKKVRQALEGAGRNLISMSSDYEDFWDQLFPDGRPEREKLLQGIYQIFREENKIPLCVVASPDVSAGIYMHMHRFQPQLFTGHIVFQINSVCLADAVNGMAEEMARFAVHIAETYHNIGGRVMLQPNRGWSSPHDLYFILEGNDGSHEKMGCEVNEWYPAYYLPGTEWFNIISPFARCHLHSEINGDTADPEMIIAELSGGALVVRSQKPITAYDVTTACKIKEFLYMAVIPGVSSFSIRKLFYPKDDLFRWFWMGNNPRSLWEIVPVLDGEIDIVYTDLVFSYLK